MTPEEFPGRTLFEQIDRITRSTIEAAESIQSQQTKRPTIVALIKTIGVCQLAMIAADEETTLRPLPDWWEERRERLSVLLAECEGVVRHKDLHGDN